MITAYNERRYAVKPINGYQVHYLPIYYTNHLSFWSRVHAFWLFAYNAYRVLKKIGPVDLNYVISTPLTTGLIAILAKKRMGVPYIFEVGDLWPEAPIQLGVLKNPMLIWLAKKLEKTTYKNAQDIVALSPGIQEYISEMETGHRIEVVTNMADTDLFRPSTKSSNQKFTIGYLGTFGLANHLEYLVDAIKVAPDSLEFLLMGSGAQYDKIKNMTEGLPNVIWCEEGGKDKVKEEMESCDAIYISFHHSPVLATGCPNKLFDGLAAGKLIITNFGGWVKELIETEGCGIGYDPQKPEELFQKLSPFIEDAQALEAAQNQSRKLAELRFSPQIQLEKLGKVIK